MVGVVHHDDVPRVEIVTEGLQGGHDRELAGPHVDGKGIRQGDDPAPCVEDGSREIVGLTEGRRRRGPDHGVAHLVGDRVKAAPDDLGGDGINVSGIVDQAPFRSHVLCALRRAVRARDLTPDPRSLIPFTSLQDIDIS